MPNLGTSLMVQWLRLHFLMQGMQIRSLVGELIPHMLGASSAPRGQAHGHSERPCMPQGRPDTTEKNSCLKKGQREWGELRQTENKWQDENIYYRSITVLHKNCLNTPINIKVDLKRHNYMLFISGFTLINSSNMLNILIK